MNIKSLTSKVTNRVGKHVLTAQAHSPAVLVGVGIVGFAATTIMACRATLKLSEVLEKAEKDIIDVEHSGDASKEETKKSSYNIKIKVAVDVVKLYAPAIGLGVVTVAAFTGSHVILKRRNAGLAAAYAIVDKSFKDYRNRVIDDQGKQKDFEYRFGAGEREIVEEGEHGPEVKVIKGPDANAIKKNVHSDYARIFDEYNKHWSLVPNQNLFFITSMCKQLNDKLDRTGRVYLNEVYQLLGYEEEDAGQVVGWLKNPKDPNAENYIDFGIWDKGTYRGLEWLASGCNEGFILDFNVQGVILDLTKR